MRVVAAGGSLGGEFYCDPVAGRPARLRNTIRLVAQRVTGYLDTLREVYGRATHRALFVTLTYAKNTKGDPRDVSKLLRHVRDWLRVQGEPMAPNLWVAELQQRGALHYHLMLWIPRRLRLPKLDKRGWWPHGMTKVETARNPVGYLVKYASKFKDDARCFRKGTRLYGYGGLPGEVRDAVRRARWPRWARRVQDARSRWAFRKQVRREIEEQVRAEAELLAWLYPGLYEPPLPPQERYPGEWDVLAYEEQQRELDAYRQENVARRLLHRGWALFAKCSGGFVDRLTGQFFETPWAAEFTNGYLRIWRKGAV